MQREAGVRVREVISALRRLLSALGLESVPSADSFRRAKFNKPDSTEDLWKLLHRLLMKLFERDCTCQPPPTSPLDPELEFVRSALWYTGYGGWWVTRAQTCKSPGKIGSRDLLLALGWVMSSDNLLETLLAEKVQELELLSSTPARVPGGEDLMTCLSVSEGGGAEGGDVRSLQWHYGKLRLQWRSLLAAQQEQSKLCHKIQAKMFCSREPEVSTADVPERSGSTGLQKDLESIQCLNRILEAYLEWKAVEPLFWCWMDSVMDGHLSDQSREKVTDESLKDRAVPHSCPHEDNVRKSFRHLNQMLLKLQTDLRRGRLEQTTLTFTAQDRSSSSAQLSPEQKRELERDVAARLQGLSLANTPTATSRGFIPNLQEPPAPHSVPRLRHGVLNQENQENKDGTTGRLQASAALKELKDREAVLLWELELLKKSQRLEMQAQTSALQGLVFIPPLKR
ncbi:hypothetical protein AMEX_G17441 [Astyanax mexicanus]|uniref:Si:dkey-84k17.2 n=1 Tax=Astyanax mexicanus TaxID=7994 RepID=A0A8B9K4W3_ASTMX|nr:hypothetical protein AMEX_G17441 [Astyanax mexicanus]